MPKNFTLKFGDHKIRVLHVSSEKLNELYDAFGASAKEDKMSWGAFIPPNVILMNNSLELGSYYLSVLFHEIKELINDFFGTELDHRQLSTLAEGWSMMLTQNKKKIIELLG